MRIPISRTDNDAAEHGRRIMRERREREAAELRRANARLPFVDDEERAQKQKGRPGMRAAQG
jgi:hypothetical protein